MFRSIFFAKISLGKLYKKKTKTKKNSYWRLDDENEDDGDDDDTVWMMTTMMMTIGTLRSNDADDNENVKKNNRLNRHFFPVFARLRRENA